MKKIIHRLLHGRSLAQLAAAELDEEQRRLMRAQSAREYASACVAQHLATIARLSRMLDNNELIEYSRFMGDER